MLVIVAMTRQLIAFNTVLVWDSIGSLNRFTVFSPGGYYTWMLSKCNGIIE